MRALIFLAGLLWTGGAWGAHSPFQLRCDSLVAKPLSVRSSVPAHYQINNTVPYRELALMKEGEASAFVLGLTTTSGRVGMVLDGHLLEDARSGYECIVPEIEVTLDYGPVIIYVASEFAPGSCAYREILEHELLHRQVYLSHMPKVEATVRALLTQRFDGRPVYAPIGEARHMLQDEINRGWMLHFKSDMERVLLAQAGIDTVAEYTRLSKVCKGKVQSIIGSDNSQQTP